MVRFRCLFYLPLLERLHVLTSSTGTGGAGDGGFPILWNSSFALCWNMRCCKRPACSLPAKQKGQGRGGTFSARFRCVPRLSSAVFSRRCPHTGPAEAGTVWKSVTTATIFVPFTESSSCKSPCIPLKLLNRGFQSSLYKQSTVKQCLVVLTNKSDN